MKASKQEIEIKLTGEDKRLWFINDLLAMPFFQIVRTEGLEVTKDTGNEEVDVLLTLTGVSTSVVLKELVGPLREMKEVVSSVNLRSSEASEDEENKPSTKKKRS